MEEEQHILVIADSEAYFKEVKQFLSELDVQIKMAFGSKEGLMMARKSVPAGFILEVDFKESDGIELCQELRGMDELMNSFIVLYTDEDEEYIQISGLNAGADDYIVRPVRSRVMLSRISALIRRKKRKDKTNPSELIQNGDIIVDREKYIVLQQGNTIALPRKEFELLCLLMNKPGRVYSRAELSHLIWSDDIEVKGRTIDVHIRKIREKLGGRHIHTVKGIGYKWAQGETVNV